MPVERIEGNLYDDVLSTSRTAFCGEGGFNSAIRLSEYYYSLSIRDTAGT